MHKAAFARVEIGRPHIFNLFRRVGIFYFEGDPKSDPRFIFKSVFQEVVGVLSFVVEEGGEVGAVEFALEVERGEVVAGGDSVFICDGDVGFLWDVFKPVEEVFGRKAYFRS